MNVPHCLSMTTCSLAALTGKDIVNAHFFAVNESADARELGRKRLWDAKYMEA